MMTTIDHSKAPQGYGHDHKGAAGGENKEQGRPNVNFGREQGTAQGDSNRRVGKGALFARRAHAAVAVGTRGQGRALPTLVNNDPDGHGRLAAWLHERGVRRVGIEASGGYEMDAVVALRNIGCGRISRRQWYP
jgi:hypothetical protein